MSEKFKALKIRIAHRLDLWLYSLFYPVVNRILERNRGYVLLSYLNFSKWLQEHPPSDEEMKRANQVYCDSMQARSEDMMCPQ